MPACPARTRPRTPSSSSRSSSTTSPPSSGSPTSPPSSCTCRSGARSPDGAYGPVDLIVFDLDPGAPATIVECCAVAGGSATSSRIAASSPVAKTSGSKGLQLYARLDPPWPWEQAHAEAREIAQIMEREHPAEVLSNMRQDLREGKVLIDWSQNHAAKTTIAPYSLRALPVPSVSTPITWDEVQQGADGGGATLRFLAPQVLERVEPTGRSLRPPDRYRSRRSPPRAAVAKAPGGPGRSPQPG